MSKNTARHIFTTRRMDLSDASLKALEAQVLYYSRAEVGHALNSLKISIEELLQIITPGQWWPRRFEVPCIISCLCSMLHCWYVIVRPVSLWAVCWASLSANVTQRGQGVSTPHTRQPVWCDGACPGVHQLQHPLPGVGSSYNNYIQWEFFTLLLAYLIILAMVPLHHQHRWQLACLSR